MKKIIKLIKVTLPLVAFFFNSCENETEEFGKAFKPTLSVAQKTYTVSEGQTLNLKFNIDSPIKDVMEYKLVVLPNGTAEAEKDFMPVDLCLSNDPDCGAIEENGGDVGYLFEVPAFSTSFELPISVLTDFIPEGNEKFKVKVLPRRNLKGKSDEIEIDVTITNRISENILAKMDWSGEYDGIDGKKHDFCDLDLDLELYDENFDIVESSYTNCPEQIIAEGLQDGEYYIYGSLWSYNSAEPKEDQDIPLTVTVAKEGLWNKELTFTDVLTTGMSTAEEGNGDAYVLLGILRKNGSIYTLLDANEVQIIQGRMSNTIPKKILKIRK